MCTEFPLEEEVKVLGITIDRMMALDQHHSTILSEALVRRGILGRGASTVWGLEWGVLKMTHDSVICSLLRYAQGFVGFYLLQDLFEKMDTRIINVAARKISELELSARIDSLHFLSGTWSYSNY